jgi:hypothetical protein
VDGAPAARPLVGLFGAFDTGDLGEVALRRVVEGELRRRRPDIDLVVLAPFGWERPIPGDEGRPARPLPSVEEGGVRLDALIITGDVLADDAGWAARYAIGPDAMAERGVAALATSGTRAGAAAAGQVIWFGAGAPDGTDVDVSGLMGRDVWVRDPATQQRIGGTAVQSGDPMLLASRIFAPDALRRRADLLRMCGALPAGRRLVVEITHGVDPPALNARLADAVTAALRADPTLSLIVLSLNPTAPGPSASGLDLGGPTAAHVHLLPTWAGLDDIAAAISGATAVVATTAAGAHLAAALGIPVAAIETAGEDRLSAGIPILATDLTQRIEALLSGAKPVDISAAVTTLDGACAELAERLPRVGTTTDGTSSRDAVESALAVLQQRLVDERTALQSELSRVQGELEHLQASPEHRIARPIREGYQRWQRRRT